MRLKKGNAITLKILTKDDDGNLITNLADATAISFMLKRNNTDSNASAMVNKDLDDGITVDDPSSGYIRIALTSVDTGIDIGTYKMGLQITYSATNIQEINIIEGNKTIDRLQIVQDVIR
jgi:hypothetical protein